MTPGWEDEDMMHFGKSLPAYVSLAGLMLDGNNFTDAGLHVVLGHLPLLKDLAYLGLSSTVVSGTAFRVLADCRLPAMRHVNLNRSRVDDDGLRAIAQAMSCFPELSKLSLLGCTNFGAVGAR